MATKCIVIGQDTEQKKELKPIEFIKYLNGDGVIMDGKYADKSCYDLIELICKNYTTNSNPLDVMFAYDKGDRSRGIIFLGHWNDGVV